MSVVRFIDYNADGCGTNIENWIVNLNKRLILWGKIIWKMGVKTLFLQQWIN